MKPKFNPDDRVQVRATASPQLRPGAKAWIVGSFETRPRLCFDRFPEGIVYTIEFGSGASLEIHENDLEAGAP